MWDKIKYLITYTPYMNCISVWAASEQASAQDYRVS